MKTKLRKHNLKKIFALSAAEYANNFGRLNNLIIFSNKGLIYLSDSMKDKLKGKHKILKNYIKEELNDLKGLDIQASTVSNDYMEGLSTSFSSISINMSSYCDIFDQEKKGKIKSKIFEFDHEFGHLIAETPYKINNRGRRETIADSFALLMHIKRFGKKDLSFFDSLAAINANFATITGNAYYYYPRAIYATKALAKELDIEKLSIKQIAKCATQIGNNFSVSNKTIKALHKAYKPAKKLFEDKKVLHGDCLIEIAKIMLANKEKTEIYRAGKLYLSSYDNQLFSEDMKTYNKEWIKLSKEMEEFEEKTNFTPNPLVSKNIVKFINKKQLPKIKYAV